jgi:hypothetical protein
MINVYLLYMCITNFVTKKLTTYNRMKSFEMLQYLNYQILTPKDSYWVSLFYNDYKKYNSLSNRQHEVLISIYNKYHSNKSSSRPLKNV